ncbi:hypothetical protein XBO1_1970002 [Xenorhabdus bovienii str. oregonense]|uniref:Uncharacterized protein n=1 Tax=Xenorhabdus bovienii str. oregonense TaxID=1398202 RepID=A0A077P784_XENBV|nr:hypothetical protein XBO1_1970002 [Xenorhabdus bovienii str. oregonense]
MRSDTLATLSSSKYDSQLSAIMRNCDETCRKVNEKKATLLLFQIQVFNVESHNQARLGDCFITISLSLQKYICYQR